jgi:hypothetical protein
MTKKTSEGFYIIIFIKELIKHYENHHYLSNMLRQVVCVMVKNVIAAARLSGFNNLTSCAMFMIVFKLFYVHASLSSL